MNPLYYFPLPFTIWRGRGQRKRSCFENNKTRHYIVPTTYLNADPKIAGLKKRVFNLNTL